MSVTSSLANVGELDRRTYIGGSRVSAIMGLDPYGKTPLTEYLSIIGDLEDKPDPARLAFFEWRKEWEPIVIKRVIREFDAKIVNVNQRYRDDEHDFLAAEIDAEWVDENGELQNLEIKTVHPIAFSERTGWGDEGTADVPINYAAQCMWGLGITGRSVCILVAMAGIDHFVFYRIERDEETIALMRERMVAFWHENVLARVPPEPINYDDCLKLTLRMRGKPVELDDATATRLDQLRRLRNDKAAMEGDESEIKFEILNYIRKAWRLTETDDIADNAVLLRDGQKVATYNAQVMNRVDSVRLKEERPEIAAAYMKSTWTRVLRISKPK